MFFALSKTLGLLILPEKLALCLLLLWLILRWRDAAPRLRRLVGFLAVALPLFFATPLIANLLVGPLEEAHQRPAAAPEQVSSIILLGGLTQAAPERPLGMRLTGAVERFVETLRLARRYPSARVIMSGGSSSLVPDGYSEARRLFTLAGALGISEKRILVESKARNTRDNARFVARILRTVADSGPRLLVTSASHMPRAIACFARAGVQVTPWPVDWRKETLGATLLLPSLSALQTSRTAIREYAGWLAYRLAGYI